VGPRGELPTGKVSHSAECYPEARLRSASGTTLSGEGRARTTEFDFNLWNRRGYAESISVKNGGKVR
jgi:hypothetical protein